ncbi:hypothetical protein EJB05_32494, partial [Eragrostis curvula]
MASTRLGVITLSLSLLLTASCCAGRDFIVDGGRNGWTTNPAEPKDHFQINDTLVFRHEKGDAVLWVNQDGYNACSTTKPIVRLDEGRSSIVLNSAGYHFYISADAKRCHEGERLGIFVADVLPPPSSSADALRESRRSGVPHSHRYDKDVDAVLLVTENHYAECNTTEPLLRFVLTIPGSNYFFISADARRCRDGHERLIVNVL